MPKAWHIVDRTKLRRFTALFDTDGNGVIQRDEFIEFAQFLTVMNFLTNTEEGQNVCLSAFKRSFKQLGFLKEVNLQAEKVVQQSLKTDAMLETLEQEPCSRWRGSRRQRRTPTCWQKCCPTCQSHCTGIEPEMSPPFKALRFLRS